MTMSFRKGFLLIGCIGIMAVACKSPGNSREEETAKVLGQPPYAQLTDSLRDAKDPIDAGLYFRRGELLSRNNQHELAANDFKKAWELHPEEITGFRYASTLSIVGQTDRAIQLLKDCRQRFPANTSFAGMLGELYQQSGKMKEALDIYTTLLHTDSSDFEAWYEKGLLLEKTADTTGAITALEKAWSLQPVNTYGLELAHLYAENRNAAALTICDAILRKDSARELLDPFFIKGIYYSNTTQYKKAIVQFDSCIGRDWKFTDAYLEKGIALFKQNNYAAALNTFELTIKVSNTYADGYFWIGRCYEANGDKDQALLYYERALALDKTFTEAAERIRRLK